MPKCRICKIEIDKEKDDWIMPKNKWYYHRECYENWKKSTPSTDEEYKAFIYDFISRDLKVKYNYHMCEAQIDKFVKENKMTVKGIFFTLKYFYEVKKHEWDKGHGGIGIVPYVYNEACAYWVRREEKSKGVVEDIERQMKEATSRKKTKIQKKTVKPKKLSIDLDSILDMEDEE